MAAVALLLLGLSGCASFRSYNHEMSQTLDLAAAGNIGTAIEQLEKRHRDADKDLLYYFELGELQRLANRLDDSQKSWMAADLQVQAWEAAARADPEKLLGGAAAFLINEKLAPYTGHDYEKVMLSTRIALNHLALGEWDNARVAIRRTHEREAVIAELRAREVLETEEEAKKRGARTSFKELNGYPVRTIDNDEVNALKNSYQSAFSHYLAGFVYEALGEPSLAAAGYRQAIELRPGEPLLEQALEGLDARVGATDDGLTDVLFVIESGAVPARTSQQFNLPVPYNNQLLIVPVSFPVLRDRDSGYLPGFVRSGDTVATPAMVTSIDAMARRALQDAMPGIMLRGTIRSLSKAALQYNVGKQDETGLAGLAVLLGSLVTESADERGWRALPARIAVARARLPADTRSVEVDTPYGPQAIPVKLSGRYALVGLRVMQGRLYAIAAPEPGSTASTAEPF